MKNPYYLANALLANTSAWLSCSTFPSDDICEKPRQEVPVARLTTSRAIITQKSNPLANPTIP